MKTFSSFFRPFTRCCGAPAAPSNRVSKDKAADAGKVADADKVDADAVETRNRNTAGAPAGTPNLPRPPASDVTTEPDRADAPPTFPDETPGEAPTVAETPDEAETDEAANSNSVAGRPVEGDAPEVTDAQPAHEAPAPLPASSGTETTPAVKVEYEDPEAPAANLATSTGNSLPPAPVIDPATPVPAIDPANPKPIVVPPGPAPVIDPGPTPTLRYNATASGTDRMEEFDSALEESDFSTDGDTDSSVFDGEFDLPPLDSNVSGGPVSTNR